MKQVWHIFGGADDARGKRRLERIASSGALNSFATATGNLSDSVAPLGGAL
ncbi:MAG: hypothetical protein LBP89_04260 [Helicobacteraceae bacterium]|nr:hypothetical protein [Helicobacteraceae bacterium]